MNYKTHERILREALGGQMSARALNWVVAANLRCDLYQLSAERHFDNAPDRETLAKLWEKGLNRYYLRALDLTLDLPRRRKQALEAFGVASHALADFYAHTNWVEIQARRGEPTALAPLLEKQFIIQEFPEEIESGYYSLRYGRKGCPKVNEIYQPPPPFTFCHEMMAKDHADHGHGADRAGPDGPTYFELAVDLAVRSTRAIWGRLCREAVELSGKPDIIEILAWAESR